MIIALRSISLACFVLYSLFSEPITNPLLLFAWIISVISSAVLAPKLNRSAAGWAVASIALPFWGSAFLSLSHKKPANALAVIDNCWLNMERPTNRMVVTGIMFFNETLDEQSLKSTLNSGLLQFDRFKQRVVEHRGFNCWEHDLQFDLENHLNFHKADEKDSFKNFHTKVNKLTEQTFDMSKPLWQMDVFQGVNGGSVLVVRIHHCIADGIALIRVLLSMTKPTRPDSEPPTTSSNAIPAKESTFTQLLRLIAGLFAAFPQAFKLPDSPSPLKNPLSGQRTTAWSAPMKLQQIRKLGQAHQGKINDIILAATAGALRSYLIEQGSNPDDMTLRVLVPINLKPLDGDIELGNKVGFVYMPLPIQKDSRIKRLLATKAEMDTIKGGQQAMLSFLGLKLIGALPTQFQGVIIDTLNKNASSTMTNVPGPQAPLLLANSEIQNMIFFGPQSGTMGVGISVLSYADKMMMGLNTDANLIPDPERLVELFVDEIENWPEPTH